MTAIIGMFGGEYQKNLQRICSKHAMLQCLVGTPILTLYDKQLLVGLLRSLVPPVFHVPVIPPVLLVPLSDCLVQVVLQFIKML